MEVYQSIKPYSFIQNWIVFLIVLISGTSCEYPDYFKPPQDDPFEENDNELQAFNLSTYENQYLSTINNTAIHLDADWYKFTIESPQTIRISCRFTFDYDNDLDLKLYYNNSYVAFSAENTSDEILTAELIELGTYYIHVYNGLYGDKGRGTSYDLKWEIL